MDINKIIDSITIPHTSRPISLEDCPTTNPYSSRIVELLKSITYSIGNLEQYVENNAFAPIVKNLWTRNIDGYKTLINDIGEIKLTDSLNLKKKDGASLQDQKIKDLQLDNLDELDEGSKRTIQTIIIAKNDLNKIICNAFKTFNNIWTEIQSVDGITSKDTTPTIEQIYYGAFLLSDKLHISQHTESDYPKWDALCKEVKSCICSQESKTTPIVFIIVLFLEVIISCWVVKSIDLNKGDIWWYYLFLFACLALILAAGILLFYKYMQFLSRNNEIEAKMKEKMMDKIFVAFNEDRDNGMFRTKTEISLQERLEKSRIEEWVRNKEHERKMNCLEQERIAKLSDVLVELEKMQDKTTK